MRLAIYTCKNLLFLLLLGTIARLQAQQNNCTFKEPLLNINFGTTNDVPAVNIFPLPNYRQVNTTCPPDSYYSFVSATSDCFRGDWLTFNGDHTGNDKDGRMMVVNASPQGGVFFNTIITGLLPNTAYELAVWMVNVCRISGGCPPLPPNIIIKLLTPSGQKVASFHTGLLAQNVNPHWTRYAGMFNTPASVNTLVLTMEDITTGGCGNDFALDDITIRECVKPTPVIKPEVKPEVKPVEKQEIPVSKASAEKIPGKAEPIKSQPAKKQPVKKQAVTVTNPKINKTPEKLPPVKKDVSVTTIEKPKRIPDITPTVIKEKPVALPAPKVIVTRANPLIKQIETASGEIVIDVYDNGEIDGDTVSVYHNNALIVSRVGLSAKATSFRIKVDAANPHHELIMVAHNLGSIPPNTSMMIVTTSEKRYEVFISSSEEKNAKIIIDLKE